MDAWRDLISAMPELAEVEFARKRWDPGLGQRVISVQLHAEKRIFRGVDSAAIRSRLVGRRLLLSMARGKQLLFVFSGNNRKASGVHRNIRSWLGIHLGMSGKLRIEAPDFEPEKHDHLLLRQKRQALVFRDARQFGRVRFHDGEEEPDWWRAIGTEPHSPEFSQEKMTEFVRRHGRAPIKAVLLNQQGFPGVGNWMADEILWRARIAPYRKPNELSAKELGALWRRIRFVSRVSMRTIGRDNSDLPRGWLLHERWREDGKCPRHGTRLRRATIGGRTTAWCPRCQR